MRRLGLTLVAVSLVAVAGCSGSAAQNSSGAEQPLTVYAAASLTSVFTDLGRQFEADHPGTQVRFSFAGSSDLVAQLQQGAPADVFASADQTNMDRAVDAHLVAGSAVVFASNTLEIVVPPDNPAGVTSLQGLATPGTKVVVCAPQVPCGAAALEVQKSAGMKIHPVSEEQSVTDVLNKVATGEADAGLVYVTDVKAAGDKVQGITFPQAARAVNRYPIAAMADSRQRTLADEFIDLVTGPAGRSALAAAGFAGP